MENGIILLFGSGISYHAKYPTVKEITSQVLSGNCAFRHTDSKYYLGKNNTVEHDDYVASVVEFLSVVREFVKDEYKQKHSRDVNYEDLYYLISQIRDNQLGEYENPAIKPFTDRLVHITSSILSRKKGRTDNLWKIDSLTEEACNYIQDIVSTMLSKEPCSIDYLRFLTHFQSHFDSCNIFTLNHDTLIESFFSQNNIQFTDGFGMPENDVRYWNPELFTSSTDKYLLYKLHGSIDWYRYTPGNGTWLDEQYGIPVIKDQWNTRDRNGKLQSPGDGRPIFLAGTFNKILRYTDEIFIDLHCKFSSVLRKTRRAVVCGYGFNDKAINSQLISWMYHNPDNKLIVIHKHPDDLGQMSRGAFSRRWHDWQDSGKVIIIRHYIETVSWDLIQPNLS